MKRRVGFSPEEKELLGLSGSFRNSIEGHPDTAFFNSGGSHVVEKLNLESLGSIIEKQHSSRYDYDEDAEEE